MDFSELIIAESTGGLARVHIPTKRQRIFGLFVRSFGFFATLCGLVKTLLDAIGRVQTAASLIPSWYGMGEFFLQNWMSVVILAIGIWILWKNGSTELGSSWWRRTIYTVKHHEMVRPRSIELRFRGIVS